MHLKIMHKKSIVCRATRSLERDKNMCVCVTQIYRRERERYTHIYIYASNCLYVCVFINGVSQFYLITRHLQLVELLASL